MFRISTIAIVGALLLLPLQAPAHKAFLLPSATVLVPGETITVDAAVSNDLFYFNHRPLDLAELVVIAPDGAAVAVDHRSAGALRSSFDLVLTQTGTYRIAIHRSVLMAIWEEAGERRRWRGSAQAVAAEVPAEAPGLQVTQMDTRIETFATAGAPTWLALKPVGVGLELLPDTPPNDLVVGETAALRLLLDGEPAAGVKVTLVPGGTRYRDQQAEAIAVTDAQGRFHMKWERPGMWWLNAAVEQAASASAPRARRVSYTATLEVLP